MALTYAFCFFQSDADLCKIGLASLLAKNWFHKSIWRVAIHEQKESLEKAVLRMCSEDGEENYGKRIIESVQSTHTRGA